MEDNLQNRNYGVTANFLPNPKATMFYNNNVVDHSSVVTDIT